MNRIVSGMISFVILIYILNWLVGGIIISEISTSYDSYQINESVYKDQVGEKIEIDGITLTIVDYSIIEDNFTLSNGTKINSVMVIDRVTPIESAVEDVEVVNDTDNTFDDYEKFE